MEEGQSSDESEDSEGEAVSEGGGGRISRKSGGRIVGVGMDKKTEEFRLKRMKLIFRFIANYGFTEDQEFLKSKVSIPELTDGNEFSDSLLLIIAAYIQARETSSPSTRWDDVHFSPTVRIVLSIASRLAANPGTPPAPSASAFISLDVMFPDLIKVVPKMSLVIPRHLCPVPTPRWVIDAIPKKKNLRKFIQEIDQFDQLRFLVQNPHLIRKVSDKTVPAWWTRDDDVNLNRLCLRHGRDDVSGLAAQDPQWAGRDGLPIGAHWAAGRIDKICPKFTQARCMQLSLLIASYGFPQTMFDRAISRTGYPWLRKFACGDSLLDLVGLEPKGEMKLITPVTVPDRVGADGLRGDSDPFFRFIQTLLPFDSPLTGTDVHDYARAMLYRVISCLGKKSDKHDQSVRDSLKITRTNEELFTLAAEGSTCLWPYGGLTRIQAFKLMWRFQTLHAIRAGQVATTDDPLMSTLFAVASSSGLDDWECVTNSNRQISDEQCLHAIERFVCKSLIAQAASSAETTPSLMGSAVKRKGSEDTPVGTKSQKITNFFKSDSKVEIVDITKDENKEQ